MEKTVVIWDELNADVIFFLVEGDQSHLNRVYINTYYDDSTDVVGETAALSEEAFNARMEELNVLIYDADGQYNNVEMVEFPTQAVLDGARVIVAGFLP